MIIKRKLKVNNHFKRAPLENDKDLKIEKNIKKDVKLHKLESAKNVKLLHNLMLKKKGINTDNINDSKILETNENSNKSLDKQFTKNLTEKQIEEAHIESFIREHMKEYFKDEKTENSKEKTSDFIEELYKVSDNIKIQNTVNENTETLNCITGITEIPLPVEIKLKNIEESEKIRRKLLKQAKILNIKHNT